VSEEIGVEALLGRSATLTIRRFGSPGAFLGIDARNSAADAPAILLIGSEIPENAKEGDALRVFVYADSEGRPIATTRAAKMQRGQVAFLQVTACTSFGSFVDWGLAKELLVPFAEQTTEMTVGSRYPIGLYVDKSGRLAGTMRVTEMLDRERAEFQPDDWVDGEAWRNDPQIGLFVIVERAFVGLMPASEPHRLSRGEAARFRVANVMPDGKIELSLRRHAHEELAGDAQRIVDVLSTGVAPRVGDRSSPEEVRAVFGLSKKAFKRAVGRLLKQGAIDVDGDGFIVRAGKGNDSPGR
jgi:predicted RNA-binding protein (virulence factor B family)